MASVSRIQLYEATAITGDVNSSASVLEGLQTDLIAYIDVSACHADTTVSCDIEHSADGTNWLTLISMTNVVGAASREAKSITDFALPKVRAAITLAGATKSATVEVDLFYDKKR